MNVFILYIYERIRLHHYRRRHHSHHLRRVRVWFTINGTSILLNPRQEIHVMSQLPKNLFDNLSLAAVDANGKVVTPIPFDAAPVWTNSNDAAGTLVVSADGLTATLNPVSDNASTDVNVVGMINAASFGATLHVDIVAGQVTVSVASISIVEKQEATPAVKN